SSVSAAGCEVWFAYVAEIATPVEAGTAEVPKEKLADVCPAGIVTGGGSETSPAGALPSETAAPPAGAAPFSVTVPWRLRPPTTVPGLSATDGTSGCVVAITSFEK